MQMAATQVLAAIFAWAYGLSVAIVPFTLLLIKTLFKGRKVWVPRPRPLPPKCLNDPQHGAHRYIQLKDIKLHYVEAGNKSKPLVLFLHGFPEFWYSWRYQIKALKNDFWTVAVDMRGYGDSGKPADCKLYHMPYLVEDVYQLIQALGRKSCILVAHDWGGMVGYMLGHKYPEVVEKMVLMNAPHPAVYAQFVKSSWKQFFKSWYVFFFRVPFLPELLMSSEDLGIFDKIFKKSQFEESSVTDEDIEAFKFSYSTLDKWTCPINYYRMVEFTTKEYQEIRIKIPIPTLLIWGRQDIALEEEIAERSSKYFLNCKIKYVEKSGHFVQQDAPTIVNRHIKTFLKI